MLNPLAFYKNAIEETRRIIEAERKNTGFIDQWDLRLTPPDWMREDNDDRFAMLYQDQEALLLRGQVVWASTVQANNLLFSQGDDDCPAAIIYSIDPAVDERPSLLSRAAAALFDTKNAHADPDLAEFSRKITGEMEADWRLQVPPRISEGIQCYYTTTMVPRKYLPLGYLAGPIYPFLICPKETPTGVVLPGRYWYYEFYKDMWEES